MENPFEDFETSSMSPELAQAKRPPRSRPAKLVFAGVALFATGALVGGVGVSLFPSTSNNMINVVVSAPTPIPTATRVQEPEESLEPIPTATVTVTESPTCDATAICGGALDSSDLDQEEPRETSRARTDLDPRFSFCYEAISNGYGDYIYGVNPEYEWYEDRDRDGIVCER